MTIKVAIGYDPREALAYHVCSQSIIEMASEPVSIVPVAQSMLKGFVDHKNGSNQFITSRYLLPVMMDFAGWALFIDGDMIVADDLSRLWALRDDRFAVMCVKHEYKTQHPRKYVGTAIESDNIDYPRKNWSSVMLFNCAHPANRVLTVPFVNDATSQFLHRFEWLTDEQIGELPRRWNVLSGEQPVPGSPGIIHYTLGVPGIEFYALDDGAPRWHRALVAATECAGQDRLQMVERAEMLCHGR